MFTNFHGFHLVEDYHKWKKEHRIRKNPIGLKSLKLLIAICIPLFLWISPSDVYGLPELNPVEHRVLAIFVFAALMWLFDAVPAWTTSLVVVVLLLFCTSDSSLWFFQKNLAGERFANLVSNTDILHCFADPTIMLFIGGFITAMAGSSMSDQLASYGGVSTLLIGVAICSSVAMVLPISTPPNALADATGFIEQKYMVKTGFIMGLTGLLLGYLVLIFCGINGIF
ncbi:MAG: hypothetical protein HDS87_03955 [Bacteroidales bacterium]|nr:hypothetical protein [Bacteroidales bacterium]